MKEFEVVTTVEYEECQERALEYITDIPELHNRIREERYYNVLKACLIATREIKDFDSVKAIIYQYTLNQGTGRYPHNIKALQEHRTPDGITKETPKTTMGIRDSQIICLVVE